MKKYKIGYTAGVYDLFHIGHLNILRKAKDYCDYLIVGVSTDKVALDNKGKATIVPFDERCEIISSIRYVDKVISQESYDIEGKIKAVKDNHVDVVFVGSDWKGTKKWNQIEKELKALKCDVIYLPHTDGISSSIIRNRII